jgi:succinate dehydrogenase/fumarate reductase flavoprotein subunit
MAKNRWDREVDLLVAGAGPGGMTAGLVAALEGLDVLICEKSEQVGGTGATSAGTLWIPNNTQSRDAGYSDNADDAAAYLDALIVDGGADARRTTFLADGPRVIDDLVARTELSFLACGPHPDYRSNLLGAAIAGRAIIPEVFDGRLLDRDFVRIRPPINEFMLLGGMMVAKNDVVRLLGRWQNVGNFTHTVRLVLRYFIDRLKYARGTRLVMGNALIGRLFYSLKQNSVPIHFGAALDDLLMSEGRIAGAMLKTKDGILRVRTRRGVVLATGGFAHNQEMRETYMPVPVPLHSMAVAENTGDGLAAGKRVGAALDPPTDRHGGLWTPVSRVPRNDGTQGLYPHIILDRAKPGLIAVNAEGRRFVNEAVSYHDFVEGMFLAHKSSPSIPCQLICDAQFIRKYGLGSIHPGTTDLTKFVRNGYIRTAPTLQALASAINTDAQVLTETIVRHNNFAVEGSDPDFGKGDTDLNRFNGDPDCRPNPCLGPIETQPFVALEIWPAELACSTGLATDADARVLDKESTPIPGLYACGNDMDSIMAGTYPGPGTTLGPALVFAHRAAMHAAKQ